MPQRYNIIDMILFWTEKRFLGYDTELTFLDL